MKKRVLSLLMAVMMLVALVVPASATTDTSGTVTVYVTTGMFTTGGINEYPAYKGGTIYSNPNFSIKERRKDGIQNVRSLQGSCRFGSLVNQLRRTDIIRRDSIDVKFISHDAKVGV